MTKLTLNTYKQVLNLVYKTSGKIKLLYKFESNLNLWNPNK